MSKSKPKRKHNVGKTNEALARLTLRPYVVAYVMGVGASIIHRKTLRIEKPTPILNTYVQSVKHKWCIYTVCFLWRNNRHELEITEIKSNNTCYHTDLQDIVFNTNIEELAQHPSSERVNVGWLAIPSGQVLESEEVCSILEKLNPYDQYVLGSLVFDDEKQDPLLNEISILETHLNQGN
jgi:hypothetical protein